ncbi:uncharacterized protein [Battus philenor]|uniref:uncharacterized protein n=1 Tax=Battus philenor TaxID=42288 RepID=UPI0035CE9C07
MALVYSCCFWFSLRLGGILIGFLSMIQGFIILILCCIGYSDQIVIQERIAIWRSNLNLKYMQDIFDALQTDPEKSLVCTIVLTCTYILLCLLYIYGSYKCNNIFMMAYIVVELVRLVLLSLLVTMLLLTLKQNTMDLGLLIGASVIGGFILMGMFYMWICAANLPILINEKERDEQAATIMRLGQLLQANKPTPTIVGFDNSLWSNCTVYRNTDKIFAVSRANYR